MFSAMRVTSPAVVTCITVALLAQPVGTVSFTSQGIAAQVSLSEPARAHATALHTDPRHRFINLTQPQLQNATSSGQELQALTYKAALSQRDQRSLLSKTLDMLSAATATENGLQIVVAYLGCLIGLLVIVGFLYTGQGMAVVVSVSLYLLALSTVRLSVKAVYTFGQFEYPVFLTCCHAAVSSIIGFLVLLRRSVLQRQAISAPGIHEFLWKVVPIAVAFGLSLVFNNMALSMTSASYSEIIGATTPIVTLAVVLLLGLPLHHAVILPACVVVTGAVLSITGDVTATVMGTTLCFLSTICRSLKTLQQELLLSTSASPVAEPCSMMAWTCLVITLFMGIWVAIEEGSEPLMILLGAKASQVDLRILWLALLLSCFNACIVNLSMLFATKELGAVGVQVAAQVRIVLTVLGDITIFKSEITLAESIGISVVLAGAYWFSQVQAAHAKERSLPTAGLPCQ